MVFRLSDDLVASDQAFTIQLALRTAGHIFIPDLSFQNRQITRSHGCEARTGDIIARIEMAHKSLGASERNTKHRK